MNLKGKSEKVKKGKSGYLDPQRLFHFSTFSHFHLFMSYERTDKRTHDQIRNTKITPNISPYAEGSALIEVGGTKVICTASVEDRVPMFMRNKGLGWVTAEYAMLPRATNTRTQRETQAAFGQNAGNSTTDRPQFASCRRYKTVRRAADLS